MMIGDEHVFHDLIHDKQVMQFCPRNSRIMKQDLQQLGGCNKNIYPNLCKICKYNVN